MNILHRYTLQTLKRNRSRTLVTIVGIVLSVSMLTAVTVLISSCQSFLVRCAIEEKGNWHGVIYSVHHNYTDDFEQAAADNGITDSFCLQRLGYHRLDESMNFYKPYLYVAGADKGFFENMPVKLTRGRLPENENEIILPDHLWYNGGMEFGIGQQLDTDIFRRINYDGRLLWQNTDYTSVEMTVPLFSNTYTVVGLYEKPSFESWSAPGFTGLTVISPQLQNPVDIYFLTADKDDTSTALYNCLQQAGDNCNGGEINLEVLRFTGAAVDTGYNSRLYRLAAILMIIIILASICLIYNSFIISVNERIRQFGLLGSVGATAKQLKTSVLYEALLLCIVAVPLGIACGIAGTGITLQVADERWLSSGLQRLAIAQAAPQVSFDMVITPSAVTIAVLLGTVTVLLSAWLPAARAISVSPIDAIRGAGSTHISRKDTKESALIQRILPFECRLALRNFRRSKARYRATIVSLVISITLFVATFMVVNYMTDELSASVADIDYDLIYYYNSYNDLPLEERYIQLKQARGVTDSGYFVSFRDNITVAKMYLANPEMAHTDSRIMMNILFVDDENFCRWLDRNNVDVAQFYDSAFPRGVTTNIYRSYDIGNGIYTDQQVLDRYSAPAVMKVYDAEFEIVAACKDMPYGVRDAASAMPVVFPFSMMEQVIGTAGYNAGMINCRLAFSCDNPRQTMTQMESMLGQSRYNIYNARGDYEQQNAVISLIRLFAYGFIALISMIAIANVINTISTNISLRRREFAIFRSSGMSDKGFARMLKTECLIYGLRAIGYGLPTATIFTALLWNMFTRYDGGRFPVKTVVIAAATAVCSVLAVVYITMLYANARLKRENLLDVLKNDNI